MLSKESRFHCAKLKVGCGKFHLVFIFVRRVNITLGARDFSSAVSGFCQVFIVPSANTENSRRTREKPLVPRVGKHWSAHRLYLGFKLLKSSKHLLSQKGTRVMFMKFYEIKESTSLANSTPDGKVICRKSNRINGYSLKDCSFVNACNRKINGKACAQSHPFYNYQEISKSGISRSTNLHPPPPPLPSWVPMTTNSSTPQLQSLAPQSFRIWVHHILYF